MIDAWLIRYTFWVSFLGIIAFADVLNFRGYDIEVWLFFRNFV